VCVHKLVLLQWISVCRRPVENKNCEFVANTEDSWSGIHKFTRGYHVKWDSRKNILKLIYGTNNTDVTSITLCRFVIQKQLNQYNFLTTAETASICCKVLRSFRNARELRQKWKISVFFYECELVYTNRKSS